MDGRRFIADLFGNTEGRTCLPIRPVYQYSAELGPSGQLSCGDRQVARLADIGALCRRMLDDGLDDLAMQVRTPRGKPVLFTLSIAAIADPVPVPAARVQLTLDLSET